jgi:hypothetical protein
MAARDEPVRSFSAEMASLAMAEFVGLVDMMVLVVWVLSI